MKNRLWSTLFLSTALCLSLAACAPAPDSGSSTDSSTTSSQGTDTNASSTTIRLTSGHYTAGIDFPAGTYDLEAIAWSGNVSSSNGSINLAMGRNIIRTGRTNTGKLQNKLICLQVRFCLCAAV